MTIDNRNLPVGTRLVATYKKVQHVCTVEQTEDGKTEYVLDDGRRIKSPSAAGSAVMNGMACNGWRFWPLADEAKAITPTNAPAAGKTPKADKQGRILRKAANQKAVPEGHVRMFCAACGESHLMDVSQGQPTACPNGHAATSEEFFASDAP
jgi:hypothetical protein